MIKLFSEELFYTGRRRNMGNDEIVTNCLLSIIVPVYNTEKYIENCLDSL